MSEPLVGVLLAGVSLIPACAAPRGEPRRVLTNSASNGA